MTGDRTAAVQITAVQVTNWGSPPTVVHTPTPTRDPGTTLVRMYAAALGHLDRTIASGSFPQSPRLPYSPGVEGSGTVLQSAVHPVGAAVWIRGGGVGVAVSGTCGELVVVPDGAVHPSPPGADPLLAACFFSPATSAMAAVSDLGLLQAGERVAVTGAAGAVGSLAVQLALLAGAGEVIGCVSRPERVPLVPAGARAVVGEPDGESVDLLVDTIGGPGLADRLGRVRPGGRAVLLGYTAGTRVEIDLPLLMARDVALLPLNAVRRAPQAFQRAGALLTRLSTGELSLRVESFPLDQAAEAWAHLASGRAAGRVVLLAPAPMMDRPPPTPIEENHDH